MKRYKTRAPRLTETTLTKIRTAARRYVLAGGSPFLANDDDGGGLDEHIGNVEMDICREPNAADAFDELLDSQIDGFKTLERIYKAGWDAITVRSDAAFQFGVCVGRCKGSAAQSAAHADRGAGLVTRGTRPTVDQANRRSGKP